ncbi:MAG TPA: carboxypeptidase-like regulatory domain-containing protein, partial [Terriglobales bacterium]
MRNHCVRRAAAFSISVLTIASGTACLKHVSSLPPGPITVSGQVTDANGAALPSGNVRLIREHTYIQTTPDPSGHYAFSSLAAGSYFLLPHKPNCRFLPPAADLDHLTANTSQDFGGDGPACGGEFTVNAGAMTGPLTIGGHVHDSSGNPVLGARIDLGEHEKAVRFTDLTGSYVFHVKAEDYRLHISGACVFTPKQVKEDDLKANATQDFTAGPGCVTVTATQTNLNPSGSVFTVRKGTTLLGTTFVRLQDFASAGDAQAQLTRIVSEQSAPASPITIAGYPAIERQVLVNLSGPEQEPDIKGAVPQNGPFMVLTTAIAVGNTVVRFESQLPGAGDPATIALFFQTARNFNPAAMSTLHGPPRPTVPT